MPRRVHWLPARLHRAILRVAHRARVWWWDTRRPEISGCCVMARDAGGRLLLVRHAYGSTAWCFPTGGLRRGEDPAAAAAREFAEELGCGLVGQRLLGVYTFPLHGARNTLHVYLADLAGMPVPDGREVMELGLFAPDDLPPRLDARVRALVARLNAGG